MFDYSFKSEALIRRVVISGEHITLYTSQATCAALQPLINQLKLDSIMSADHPAHDLLHNPFLSFSNQGDAIPHRHLKFSNLNREKNLKSIFNFLLKRQNRPDLRQMERDQFVRDLNKERKARGDEKFPAYIEKSLKQYDILTPFFPEKELENLLNAFKQYNQSKSFAFYAEQVSIHIEKTLNQNWDIIYNKNILNFGDEPSNDNLRVFEYYEHLNQLRLTLLGIHYQKNLVWCEQAVDAINSIENNPYYKHLISTAHSFDNTLKMIRERIPVKISEINRDTNLMSASTAALLILAAYFRADSTNEYLKHIIIILTVSITARYVAKPLARILNNFSQSFISAPTFFSKKLKKNDIIFARKQISSELLIDLPNRHASFDFPMLSGKSARVRLVESKGFDQKQKDKTETFEI